MNFGEGQGNIGRQEQGDRCHEGGELGAIDADPAHRSWTKVGSYVSTVQSEVGAIEAWRRGGKGRTEVRTWSRYDGRWLEVDHEHEYVKRSQFVDNDHSMSNILTIHALVQPIKHHAHTS